MAIDRGIVGREQPPREVVVERGRLRAFARATGQRDPVYTDPAAARAAGHPDLPVPPTFLFGLELDEPDAFAWLAAAGIDLAHVLHGEQAFTYHAPAHAGDVLTLTSRITDVYDRKGGALEFLVRRTEVTRAGEPVATLDQTIVVRRPAVAR